MVGSVVSSDDLRILLLEYSLASLVVIGYDMELGELLGDFEDVFDLTSLSTWRDDGNVGAIVVDEIGSFAVSVPFRVVVILVGNYRVGVDG